jgi:hypothetical protein
MEFTNAVSSWPPDWNDKWFRKMTFAMITAF